MNRRSFLRSAIAAVALATGLARTRLDLVDDPLVQLSGENIVRLIEATRVLLDGTEETIRLHTTAPIGVGDNIKVSVGSYEQAYAVKAMSVTGF